MKGFNMYVIANEDMELIDVLEIEQTVNRPNNPDDETIILDWITQNHYDLLGIYNTIKLDSNKNIVVIDENYSVET